MNQVSYNVLFDFNTSYGNLLDGDEIPNVLPQRYLTHTYSKDKELKVMKKCSLYAYRLMCTKREGQLIHLITKNMHLWFDNKFITIFGECVAHGCYKTFIFMLKYFQKRDIIKYIGGPQFMCRYTSNYEEDIVNTMDYVRNICKTYEFIKYFFSDGLHMNQSSDFLNNGNDVFYKLLYRKFSTDLTKYMFSCTITKIYPLLAPISPRGKTYDYTLDVPTIQILKYLTSDEIMYIHKTDPTIDDNNLLCTLERFCDIVERYNQHIEYIRNELWYKYPSFHKYKKLK
jgi:hypothetical protein